MLPRAMLGSALACVLALGLGSAALGADQPQASGELPPAEAVPTKGLRVADGVVQRTAYPEQPTSGLIEIVPARDEVDANPGETTLVEISVANFSDDDLVLDFQEYDLEAAADPDRLVEKVAEAQFGAGNWLVFEANQVHVGRLQRVTVEVEITPPDDAPVGSNYAGIEVVANPPEGVEEEAGAVGFLPSLLAQLLVNIPGDIVREGEISKADVSDSIFFNRGFSGRGFTAFEAQYQNDGNVTEFISGEIVVRSMFGNVVRRFPVDERVVLRGSPRNIRVLWTDPPRFGRFTGTLELETKSGFEVSEDFPTITVLPPWWWLAVLAVLIAVPAIMWWRNRNLDWEQYLDEEWDDEEDEVWDQT